MRKAFGDRYLYAGLGTTFALGATPRAVAGAGRGATTVMDEDDLKSYHVLLGKSGDGEHTLLAQEAR